MGRATDEFLVGQESAKFKGHQYAQLRAFLVAAAIVAAWFSHVPAWAKALIFLAIMFVIGYVVQLFKSPREVQLRTFRIAIEIAIATMAAWLSTAPAWAKVLIFFAVMIGLSSAMFVIGVIEQRLRASKYAERHAVPQGEAFFLAYLQTITIAIAIEAAWFSPVPVWAKALIFFGAVVVIYAVMFAIGFVAEVVQRVKGAPD